MPCIVLESSGLPKDQIQHLLASIKDQSPEESPEISSDDLIVIDGKTWQDLVHKATFDSLTDVFNRATFVLKATKIVKETHAQTSGVACIMLDIDYFKRVNDTYGHPVGDLVLRAVADILKRNCRERDVLGRLGGEEFMLLLANTDLNAAVGLADRLRSLVTETPVETPKGQVYLTVSVGVVGLREAETLDKLIDRVDAALYDAKKLGRNCVVVG